MLKANHDHRSPTMDTARPRGAAREPSVGPPVLPVPAAPHPSAPPARDGIIRTAALTALTLFTVICSLQSGLIHQELIAEHMEMNAVEGWAFVAMTAGCYASSVSVAAAGFWLWRRSHRTASLITLTAFGAFMASMIGLYFYVHAPSLQSTWLPFGVEHEPLEEAGTAAVWNEATAILAIVLIMASPPSGPTRPAAAKRTRTLPTARPDERPPRTGKTPPPPPAGQQARGPQPTTAR